MALLSTVNTRVSGVQTLTLFTLTAADVLPVDLTKRQILFLLNQTGGSITVLIDGDGGTTVVKDGVGSVSVSTGLSITIPATEARYVPLGTIRDYLQGVVNVTGGTGLRGCILQD